jgi:hypothetical protein
MSKVLAIAGNVLSGTGLLLCLLAGVSRLSGSYFVFSYEAMTVFNAGVGVMVTACLVKLY